MKTVNATTARANLYQLLADVNKSSEPVMITNAHGGNAVMISESDWNAIQETLYLSSVPGLQESIAEADREGAENATPYDPDEEW